MKTIATETISNVIAMSLNYDAECIDNMCINLETIMSEESVKELFLKAAAAGNLQDFGNSLKAAMLQSVINKYTDSLERDKFTTDCTTGQLWYNGEEIKYAWKLDSIVREKKKAEQWDAWLASIPTDFKLTDADKKMLLDGGCNEDDLKWIEIEANVCYYWQDYKSKPSREITREEAIKILGRESWLWGIERTCFHWSTCRENANGTKRVSFESGEIGRGIVKYNL